MSIINRILFRNICAFLLISFGCLTLTGNIMAADVEIDSQFGILGQNVVFTITINNAPNTLEAVGFDVAYDITHMTFQSVTAGELTQNFDMFGFNEISPGVVRIAAVTLVDEIQPGETGVFATMTFQAIGCLTSTLHFQDFTGDFKPPAAAALWTTRDGTYTCAGDEDNDGVQNGTDNCWTTPNPAQTDTDNDGYGDACDNCPGDPNKFFPGACGCGNLDTDTDGDGTADCIDECPDDPNKTIPGVCGCGTTDRDSDVDGTPDCIDNCPADPNKTVPGECDCGTVDTDTDGDGTADCIDNCAADPNKTVPGECGCGTADTDTDGDGTPDCIDDNDDSDNDGWAGNQDNCPAVSNPDQADADGDGTGDACDECPDDPDKIVSGTCGCDVTDIDSDGDGTADCIDECPDNPDKTEPGVCGCKKADIDRDGDGDIDCPSGGSSGCFLDQIWR